MESKMEGVSKNKENYQNQIVETRIENDIENELSRLKSSKYKDPLNEKRIKALEDPKYKERFHSMLENIGRENRWNNLSKEEKENIHKKFYAKERLNEIIPDFNEFLDSELRPTSEIEFDNLENNQNENFIKAEHVYDLSSKIHRIKMERYSGKRPVDYDDPDLKKLYEELDQYEDKKEIRFRGESIFKKEHLIGDKHLMRLSSKVILYLLIKRYLEKTPTHKNSGSAISLLEYFKNEIESQYKYFKNIKIDNDFSSFNPDTPYYSKREGLNDRVMSGCRVFFDIPKREFVLTSNHEYTKFGRSRSEDTQILLRSKKPINIEITRVGNAERYTLAHLEYVNDKELIYSNLAYEDEDMNYLFEK